MISSRSAHRFLVHQCSRLRHSARCSNPWTELHGHHEVPLHSRTGPRCLFHAAIRAREKQSAPKSSSAVLEKYKKSIGFPAATHHIRDIVGEAVLLGREVVVHGYLGERADLSKKLSFVYVTNKELDHSIQVVSRGQANEAHATLKTLEAHSAVAIRGLLKSRKPPEDDGSDIRRIADLEIELTEVYALNDFPKDIIFRPDTRFPPEQRHLQLRKEKSLRDALKFRAAAARVCRDELGTDGFTEVETPLLFKSTPEGAREFLVPTRREGLAYALPQSPQQYKQILMASGIAKYYQIARCFRDEDLRADRQPEFTQLDLEMSFATGEDVMQCIERLVRKLWSELLSEHDLPSPFIRMSYDEAMSTYGSDKPDTRLGMTISPIDHLLPADLISKLTPAPSPTVEAMKLHVSDDARETRRFMLGFMDSPDAKRFVENRAGAPGIFVVDPRQPLEGLQTFGFEAAEQAQAWLGLGEGDLVVLQARKRAPHTGGATALGDLRLALHRAAVAGGHIPAPTGFSFLWVNDFPLFSPSNDVDPGQGGSAGLSATHHPFSSPKTAEDVGKLLTAPLEVKADHYDLVVNGVELGGGSRRIHDARMQEYVLREVLGMSKERIQAFSHLLEVLRAGCPPHAGIALGFDRLIAVMLGRESVRDVIAFPKTGRGEDPLVRSPGAISAAALETYHLQVSS